MALIHRATLQTKTNIEAIAIVTEWFNQFQQPPLNQTLWMEAQVALLEGFTNAVLHAHKSLSSETPIELGAQLFTERFQLCIWDRGAPYDFEKTLCQLQALTNDVSFIPHEREAHWGSILLLRLINQFNWRISYTREQDFRNCLLVEKYF